MAAYPKAQYQTTRTSRASGRGAFTVLGILLIAVGAFALLFPLVAALSFNLLVGVTMLTGGILTLIHAFRLRGWSGFTMQLLLALLYIGGGLIFIANPFAGLLALTVVLGAFFAADGVARILLGLRVRSQRAWWLFLVSGILSLVLGVLVFFGLPSGWSIAFLGLIVGVNMILTGVSFLCCTGADRRRTVRTAT